MRKFTIFISDDNSVILLLQFRILDMIPSPYNEDRRMDNRNTNINKNKRSEFFQSHNKPKSNGVSFISNASANTILINFIARDLKIALKKDDFDSAVNTFSQFVINKHTDEISEIATNGPHPLNAAFKTKRFPNVLVELAKLHTYIAEYILADKEYQTCLMEMGFNDFCYMTEQLSEKYTNNKKILGLCENLKFEISGPHFQSKL